MLGKVTVHTCLKEISLLIHRLRYLIMFPLLHLLQLWVSVMECLPWDLFLGHVYDSVDSRATVGWSLMPYIF